MNTTDLIAMLGNLSRSLYPVQSLIAAVGYLLGLLFVIAGLTRFKNLSESSSHEGGVYTPIAYILGGALLIFLPNTLTILSNTAFGDNNVLQYATYNPYNVYNSMAVVIKTAGIIWFIRGSVLLIHSSQPGVQEGRKGLAYLCAGIFAMNFEYTLGMLNSSMNYLLKLTGMTA